MTATIEARPEVSTAATSPKPTPPAETPWPEVTEISIVQVALDASSLTLEMPQLPPQARNSGAVWLLQDVTNPDFTQEVATGLKPGARFTVVRPALGIRRVFRGIASEVDERGNPTRMVVMTPNLEMQVDLPPSLPRPLEPGPLVFHGFRQEGRAVLVALPPRTFNSESVAVECSADGAPFETFEPEKEKPGKVLVPVEPGQNLVLRAVARNSCGTNPGPVMRVRACWEVVA